MLAVLILVNGSTVVVGAYGTSSYEGHAYVYSLSAASNSWQLTASLSDPGAASSDYFGVAVAVNGDTLVVGAAGSNKAYVFARNQGGIAGSWGLAKTLADPVAITQGNFGTVVTVDGDFLVVGTGYAAYVFERNLGGAGAWGLAATPKAPTGVYSGFGGVIAINGDTLILGVSPYGKAYIYDLSGGSVSTDASIADPSAVNNDYFGFAVAVNGDTAVVGASGVAGGQGKAYIFERNQGGAGNWGLAVALTDPAATAYATSQYHLDYGCRGWPPLGNCCCHTRQRSRYRHTRPRRSQTSRCCRPWRAGRPLKRRSAKHPYCSAPKSAPPATCLIHPRRAPACRHSPPRRRPIDRLWLCLRLTGRDPNRRCHSDSDRKHTRRPRNSWCRQRPPRPCRRWQGRDPHRSNGHGL